MLKYGSNWLILSAVLFNSANDCITKKIIKDCPRWVRLSCSHLRMISTFRSTMHCSIRHTSISKRRPAGGLRINNKKKEANASNVYMLVPAKASDELPPRSSYYYLSSNQRAIQRKTFTAVGQGKDLEVCPVHHRQYQYVPS